MSQRTAADILKLPNSLNGHAVAVTLLTSLALSIVTVGLVSPAAGYYQLFLLIAIAPVTIIHHTTIICLLRKHRDETALTSLVPECLTRKTNIGFMVFFGATWLAGTAVGFWFYSEYHISPDMSISTGLVISSNIVALLECLIFFAMVIFCIRARNERSRVPQELDLTP
ncbi:unnamed protein product [Rhizoctonia solani]|uniref:Uncharacterized protein n=1 Tax=Rhizoctonia solani TaxID=456999 RepID=A0A8H3GSN5_9AGAM|nr:unnamed protein product [Rhizoctonia solani]